MKMQSGPHQIILLLTMSFILVACRSDVAAQPPVPIASPQPTPTTTEISSAATQPGHETFAVTGEQAQEIAVFMDFIRAYNNGRLDEALTRLSDKINGSDCDYREVKVILFRGKSQAADWLRNRFSEHDRLEVSRIVNENPDPSGAHVISVEYSHRSSTTLAALGFGKGIAPKIATKVIFEVAPTLIGSFANGPYGGDPELCRPEPAPSLSTPADVRPSTATPWPAGAVMTAAPLEPTLPFVPTWTPAPVTPVAELKGLGRLLFQCQSGALCLMNADGTGLRQITPDRHAWPRWSPDGQEFVAVHQPQADRTVGEVVLFSADGELRAAYSPGARYLLGWANPVWSPDGKWLALTAVPDQNGNGSNDPGEASEVWILNRDTLTPAFPPLPGGVLTSGNALAWSSDSHQLAFVRSGPPATADQREALEVWVFDIRSGQMRKVASGSDPAWEPHTQRLAFANGRRTELDAADMASGRTQTLLTENDLRDFLARDDPWLPKGKLSFEWPVWSPDGSAIAFRVWGQSVAPWPSYFPAMMFTVSANGADLRRWPDTDTPNTGLQVWSPQGDRLLYSYWMVGDGRYDPNARIPASERRYVYAGCCSGLIIVDVPAGTWREEPGPLSIDLQPAGSWSADGRWFVTRGAHAQANLEVISAQDPDQRWVFSDPGPEAAEVQWQPRP